MRVLVTGGAGFVGSHLVEQLLNQNHQVVSVDNLLTGSQANVDIFKKNPNFTFISHDVTQPLDFQEKLDAVFHFASPASPNHHSSKSYHSLPMETMMVNTQGTLEMLKLADRNKAKFMFASTSEVYGDPLEHPQEEDYRGNVSTTGPRSIYDEAKRFGETLTAYYWRDKGMDGRIVRIFNTYGTRMLPEDMRMIITFINQALKEDPITVFGDGKQTRSLCHVSDTVDGVLRLMFNDNTKGEVVNIGGSKEHSVLEYARLVKSLTGSKSEIVFSEKLPQDDPKQRKADTTKAKELLGWEPKMDLEKGLKELIAYFRTRL